MAAQEAHCSNRGSARREWLTADGSLGKSAPVLIPEVLVRHPEATGVILCGSRAKGTATESDIDLPLEGMVWSGR